MKYKYRLRTKKSLLVVAILLLVMFAGIFYGCSQSGLKGLLDGKQNTSVPDYKSIGKLIRKQALESAKSNGLLILVNKQNPIDHDYKPEDLSAIKYYATDRVAAGRYMRKPAASAFNKMVEAAARDGVVLKMTTAYRSYDFQKMLYDNYVSQSGEQAANRYSAKPGQSEHQTGLAVDVSSPSVNYQLTSAFGETAEGKWLANHAHKFGFILRYPEGKENITGYNYEPWHLRYVGMFAANEIYQQEVTLEEYLLDNELYDEIKE
jgi:zinc D-Ala-D-Ala carboxypeptidase